MTNKKRSSSSEKDVSVGRKSKRTTLPSSEVGVTLTISKKALAELDRIQEETIVAAQETQKFSWR